MNNQEQVSQVNSNSKTVVDNRRRFIKGAIAAPAVLTLSSGSVFAAAQCVSQILSGNISNQDNASCVLGTSVAVWASSVSLDKNPLNSATIDRSKQTGRGETCVQSVSQDINESATTKEIVVRAKLPTKASKDVKESSDNVVDFKIKLKSKPNKEDVFTWAGGLQYGIQKKYENNVEEISYLKNGEWKEVDEITVTEIPATSLTKDDKFQIKAGTITKEQNLGDYYEFEGGVTSDAVFKDSDNRTFREILTKHSDTDKAYLVAAILNAKYYNNYVLSEADVKELASSSNPKVPPGHTLKSFLAATWGE